MKNCKSEKSYLNNGRELKKKLIDKGITQATLAKRLGVHSIYVSMMVRGERPISENIRRKLLDVLK